MIDIRALIKKKGGLVQFIKFGMVGLGNTVVSYLVYTFCLFCGAHYLLANVISFFVGTLNSFYWNNKYVFKLASNEKRNFFTAFGKTLMAYAFTGVVLNSMFSVILIEIFYISEFIAPLCIIVITVPINFFLNKYWAMRGKAKRRPEIDE